MNTAARLKSVKEVLSSPIRTCDNPQTTMIMRDSTTEMKSNVHGVQTS